MFALAAALAAMTMPAAAQDAWPARPVRLVVGSSPGGGTDTYARFMAQALGESLKQVFIVENKPGAGGNLGVESVARSAPDGYTFLVSATAQIAINPSLYQNLPFDIERDFVPVAGGVSGPMVFCVHTSVPVKSLAELVELGKRQPGALAFGSAGIGTTTYLGVFMLEEASGAKFLHVPYKGMGQVYKDFLGGQVQFMFADLASALPHIKSGRALPLAVTEPSRLLPNTPTIAEAGFPKVEIANAFSFMARAGTPQLIIERLSAEIVKAMKSPALAEKLEAQAMVPVFDTPASFAPALKKVRDGWADFIRRNHIVLEQ
jgi:tripartite-type tricarboxylate transporter receptor subunit TctC